MGWKVATGYGVIFQYLDIDFEFFTVDPDLQLQTSAPLAILRPAGIKSSPAQVVRCLNNDASRLRPRINDLVRRLQHFRGTNPHLLAEKSGDRCRNDHQVFGTNLGLRCESFRWRLRLGLHLSARATETSHEIREKLRLVSQLRLQFRSEERRVGKECRSR